MKRIVLVGSIAVALPFKAGCCRLTHDVKRNEDVVRHFFENGINRGDVQSALLDLAEDTKNFGRPAGREGFRRVLEGCWVKRFSEEWSDRRRRMRRLRISPKEKLSSAVGRCWTDTSKLSLRRQA